jgi:hypothetical protein
LKVIDCHMHTGRWPVLCARGGRGHCFLFRARLLYTELLHNGRQINAERLQLL